MRRLDACRFISAENLGAIVAAVAIAVAAAGVYAAEAQILLPEDSPEGVVAKAVSVRPSPRQIAWQRDEFSAFIHFGMNTFTDREWGDGAEDPAWFNPTELDCRQWVAAAQAAGITRMILTAKHHDGFCLWPSKHTEHCVRNSPWKDGRGDVVGDFVDACKAEGMHFGLYLSPWDRHEPTYGDSPKYNEYFLSQLREVLTAYPGAKEVWFDGACAEGPNGKVQQYDWRAYWKLIRELAPEAVISVRGPDVRWCGNEAGSTRPSEWSVLPMPGDHRSWTTSDETLLGYARDIYGADLGSREVLLRSRQERTRLAWYPAQVNTSIRPGWFYHESEDDRVRTLEDLLAVYYGSVGGNAQFLLNIAPDRRGLFHEHDVTRLKQIGDVLRSTFSKNLADDAIAKLRVDAGHLVGDAANVLDSNPDTFVTSTDRPEAVSLVVELPEPRRANCLMLQEHIPSGQRVESFNVEAYAEGSWRPLGHGTVIGSKRLFRFPDTTLSKVRVQLTHFRIRPTLAEVGLYFAPALLSSPKIERDLKGFVTIVAPEGAYATYTLDGSLPSRASSRYDGPIPLPKGGVVIARTFPQTPAVDDAESAPFVTRKEFGLAKESWGVASSDSEDPVEGEARMAIDDDPDTFWHTRYRDRVDPMPHHLAVDLGRTESIRGFAYLPRQDQWDGGIVQRARFEVSQDGEDWIAVGEAAEFSNIVNSRQQQVVQLPSPVSARYFRMVALQTVNDNGLASAAELSAFIE